MLHELESLFQDGEEVRRASYEYKYQAVLITCFSLSFQSTVAMHVPVWFKFKFLSELLEASMVSCIICTCFTRDRVKLMLSDAFCALLQADIMYLFNEGHLVDFSSTELSKLVRALFADSQLRQRNLETIARGRA